MKSSQLGVGVPPFWFGVSGKIALQTDQTEPITPLVRMLISLTAHHSWKIYQLDVKSAFLNGILEEEVSVEQPKGFMVEGEEDKVYRLKKASYGLK